MSKRLKVLMSIGIVLLLAWVGAFIYLYNPLWAFDYEGEGIFADRGPRASSYRYVLVLDRYDLSRKSGTGKYMIGELPRTDMRLGLRFFLSDNEFQGGIGAREHIDDVGIAVAISGRGESDVYFQYSGPLYTPDSGFVPTTRPGHDGGVVIMYSPRPLLSTVQVFGLDTGIIKQEHCVVSFRLTDPIDKPLNENTVELIVFGGGWK